MARTHQTRALDVLAPNGRYALDYLALYHPEGASQVFKIGWPLKFASGLLAEWVSVADGQLVGFALADGQNLASPTIPAKYVAAYPEISIEGNLLDSSAADEVLVAADLGIEQDLIKGANLLGTGVAGWYIQNTAAGAAVKTYGLQTSYTLPTADAYQPAVGDTNARLRASVKAGVSFWF
jgi:hypothetical protein